jgi:fumarate reductase subunit C
MWTKEICCFDLFVPFYVDIVVEPLLTLALICIVYSKKQEGLQNYTFIRFKKQYILLLILIVCKHGNLLSHLWIWRQYIQRTPSSKVRQIMVEDKNVSNII